MPEVFIDSNIWLYALNNLGNDPRCLKSKQFILSIPKEKISVSIQVINEVSINLIKKYKFKEKDIQDFIKDCYDDYYVQDSNMLEVLTKASEIRIKYKLSFWDSLIVSSALKSGCKELISEDLQNDLKIYNKLTIRNPFQ